MIRANWVPRTWVQLGLLAVALLLPLACTNNPFNPRAELVVTEVKAPASTNASFANTIGIAQVTTSLTSQSTSFLFQDPMITLRSGLQQPEAYIDTAVSKITIGQVTLPSKRIPLRVTVPKGGAITTTIPILRGDSDIRNAVFPNNSPTLGAEGLAEVTLLGRDKNGNEISVDFTTGLVFTTLVGSSQLIVLPEPAATPVPAASGSPTPSPTPSP